jgi:hypothetical protein
MTNIRPVNHIRVNKAGKAHIHKVIREECATEDIPYVINASTVLLYDPTLSLEELLASIDVLRCDVKLRTKREPDE